MEKPTEKKRFVSPSEFPQELTVSGTFIAHSKEKREWTDKQTGQQRELEVDCIFIQSSFGILVVRTFNPSFDFSSFKAGDPICLPVDEYKKENGLKCFTFRVR